MAEEIKELTFIISDLKIALDHCFDVIKDYQIARPTGTPRTNKERLEKFNIAIELYNKHLVC